MVCQYLGTRVVFASVARGVDLGKLSMDHPPLAAQHAAIGGFLNKRMPERVDCVRTPPSHARKAQRYQLVEYDPDTVLVLTCEFARQRHVERPPNDATNLRRLAIRSELIEARRE